MCAIRPRAKKKTTMSTTMARLTMMKSVGYNHLFLSHNHRLDFRLATTNTEDSHTSLSSSTRRQARKGPYSTSRWLTTTGGGMKRARRRVGRSFERRDDVDFLPSRFDYDLGRSLLLAIEKRILDEYPPRQMPVRTTNLKNDLFGNPGAFRPFYCSFRDCKFHVVRIHIYSARDEALRLSSSSSCEKNEINIQPMIRSPELFSRVNVLFIPRQKNEKEVKANKYVPRLNLSSLTIHRFAASETSAE